MGHTSSVARPPASSAAAAVGNPSGTKHVVITQWTGLLLLLVNWACCVPIAKADAGAVGAVCVLMLSDVSCSLVLLFLECVEESCAAAAAVLSSSF
jgi:hypothetical protein